MSQSPWSGAQALLLGVLFATLAGPALGALVLKLTTQVRPGDKRTKPLLLAGKLGAGLLLILTGALLVLQPEVTQRRALWFLLSAVPLSVVVGSALAWRSLRPSDSERELRVLELSGRAPGLELLDQPLPLRLRYRVPCRVPAGLRRQVAGVAATPLGNPVLDSTLPLTCDDPERIAALVTGQEGLLLSVLHAWPHAHLETGAVVWEADLELLEERAQGELSQMVLEAMAQTRALALLLGDGQAAEPNGTAGDPLDEPGPGATLSEPRR